MEIKKLLVDDLTAKYKNQQILSGVTLEINSGEMTALCGLNGSGKSTLLGILANLNSEQLIINAKKFPYILYEKDKKFEIYRENRKEIAKKLAFMQQNEYSVWDFSVQDFILAGRYCHTNGGNYQKTDIQIVKEIIYELDLQEFAERKVHTLSGGEFQKVRLARALVQQPEFLFLDEPANNLDFIFEPKLLEILKQMCHKKNIGVVLTIHDINLAARVTDKIILLSKNEPVIYGSVNETFTDKNLSKTFKTELQTYTHPIYNCLQVYEK